MLLDKSLLENDHFTPQFSQGKIFEISKNTVEILKGQAFLKGVDLLIETDGADILLMVD